jgi:hypothetical protein
LRGYEEGDIASLARKIPELNSASKSQAILCKYKTYLPNFKIDVFLMTYHIFQQRLQQCLSSFLI